MNNIEQYLLASALQAWREILEARNTARGARKLQLERATYANHIQAVTG